MLTFLITLLATSLTASPPEWLDLVPVEGTAEVRIEGTSSLHDWTVTGETIVGQARMMLDPAASSIALSSGDLEAIVEIGVPVKSLASGKDKMDEKMFKALKASTNDLITFQLTSLESIEGLADSISATAKGNLSVAGYTQPVSMPIVVVVSQGILKVTGSLTIEMTSFGIKPPKAMLGLIRTGNTVTITFSWSLKPRGLT